MELKAACHQFAIMQYSRCTDTSWASNRSRGSDLIVLIEAEGFYSRIYGMLVTVNCKRKINYITVMCYK